MHRLAVLPPTPGLPTVLNQQTAVVDVDSDDNSGSYDADEGETMGGDTVNDTFDEVNDTLMTRIVMQVRTILLMTRTVMQVRLLQWKRALPLVGSAGVNHH